MSRLRRIAVLLAVTCVSLGARTFFVKTTGSDSRGGTSPDSAFQHIQRGADVAQSGDTVLVFAGTYRERVKPPRGGTGENARITYRANPGDRVIITGLDAWNPSWTADGSLYRATPASSLFTDNAYVDGGNPYRIRHSCNRNWCLGQVVVDGIEFVEQTSKSLANAAAGRWWADVATGTIYVNFGGSPAGRSVEITTRRAVFRPYLVGLGYITVEGFTLEYCANQTMDGFYSAGNDDNHQSGMVGTRAGHHWTIKGNTIRKAKTIGVSIGAGGFYNEPYYNYVSGPTYFSFGPRENIDNETPKQTYPPPRSIGYNLIVNNRIDSCGQAGVVGFGHFGNIIYGNAFSNIPSLNNNRSWEDGAIKFHWSSGSIIERNLFEGYPNGAWAVWLDAGAIGNRVRRNVFRGHPAKKFSAIYVEITSSRDYVMNVIDCNLFLDCNSGIGGARADGVGIYHNLFYGGDFAFSMGSQREGCVGTDRCGCGAVRNVAYNNLLIDNDANYGLAFRPEETGVDADYNVLIPAGGHFQLCDSGTGNAQFCGGTQYTCAQIDAFHTSIGNPGVYWEGTQTLWLVADSFGPLGCVTDFTGWRAMMDSIDGHTVERTRDAFTNNARSVTIGLAEDPGIGGPRIAGVGVDFNGDPIGATPKAGPFQDLGATSETYAFWDDATLPSLPAPPEAPSGFVVQRMSGENRLSWTTNAFDATHIQIERRQGAGAWEVWGYVNSALDSISDDQLTNASSYQYRIAARNAGGLSAYAQETGVQRSPAVFHPAGGTALFAYRTGSRTVMRVAGNGVRDLALLTVAGSAVPVKKSQGSDHWTVECQLPGGAYILKVRRDSGWSALCLTLP